MGRKEQVYRAVKMQGPDYVPILFLNKDQEQSDLIIVGVTRHFMGEGKNISEWGFRWERHDDTMGQPKHAAINDWAQLDTYPVPDPRDVRRYSEFPAHLEKAGDRYRIADLGISGFNRAAFIKWPSGLHAGHVTH